MAQQFLPVLITLVVATLFTVALLGFAALLSQRSRHHTAAKGSAYESGMPLLDEAHKRISIKFYLVALVFVVLDVEAAFLYPWAVTYRGFLEEYSAVILWDILAFMALLALAYIYLWRKGVFDWGRPKSYSTGGDGK